MKLSELLDEFQTRIESAVSIVPDVTVLTSVPPESAWNAKTIVINLAPILEVGSNPRASTFVNISAMDLDFILANRLAQLALVECANIRTITGLHLVVTQYPWVKAVFTDYTMISIQVKVAYDFED